MFVRPCDEKLRYHGLENLSLPPFLENEAINSQREYFFCGRRRQKGNSRVIEPDVADLIFWPPSHSGKRKSDVSIIFKLVFSRGCGTTEELMSHDPEVMGSIPAKRCAFFTINGALE